MTGTDVVRIARGVLTVELPPEPASATRARSFAREELAASVPDDTLDTVALLVTELVTNAILHARTPLQLILDPGPDVVRICVEDHSPTPPAVRTAPPTT